jgi:hypothetical protein
MATWFKRPIIASLRSTGFGCYAAQLERWQRQALTKRSPCADLLHPETRSMDWGKTRWIPWKAL